MRLKRYSRIVANPEKLKKKILEELCKIAFADIGDHISFEKDENGEIICICTDPTTCDLAAVSEISKTKSGLKIKAYNKEVALGRLGSYLGLWRERTEEEVEDLNAIKESLEEEV